VSVGPLIDGRPWGWGAFAVDTPPKDWHCPLCGRVRRRGRHWYPFAAVCTECARAACEKWWSGS
jgi:hypothetical protein